MIPPSHGSNRIMYVAEPIDQSDYGPWRESVNAMSAIAAASGWLCFRPGRAWDVETGTVVGPEIEALNRAVLALSGAVLAHLPRGVPSVGTPREVEWAMSAGRPTLVVTDHRGWSLADSTVIRTGDTAGFREWLKFVESRTPPAGVRLGFLVEDGGQLPTRANPGDAGYDMYVSEETLVPARSFVDVPCGARVALPVGVWARITGRSSTLRKRGLLVIEGVIDTGYRGPLYAGVQNLGDSDVVVTRGDRIAQLLLHENVSARHHAVSIDRGLFDRIPGDGRGEAGFGSTGD